MNDHLAPGLYQVRAHAFTITPSNEFGVPYVLDLPVTWADLVAIINLVPENATGHLKLLGERARTALAELETTMRLPIHERLSR